MIYMFKIVQNIKKQKYLLLDDQKNQKIYIKQNELITLKIDCRIISNVILKNFDDKTYEKEGKRSIFVMNFCIFCVSKQLI